MPLRLLLIACWLLAGTIAASAETAAPLPTNAAPAKTNELHQGNIPPVKPRSPGHCSNKQSDTDKKITMPTVTCDYTTGDATVTSGKTLDPPEPPPDD